MKIYTKKAKSVAEYAMMRGVTDFSNAEQFNLYEKGYQHLCIISKPIFLEKLAKIYPAVNSLLDTFCHILEYEFKNLDGIEDITVDTLEITDGISTLNVVGKVNKQSASEISMTFTEKSGSVITNFLRYYLEGIKDPRTQAKTYHGLIKSGLLAGGFENEVFNLLYIVMDNTMLQLEKSYLLCNAFPTKAPTSIYNGEKGSIEKADVEVTWQAYVLDGPEVDQRALRVLAYINETDAVYNAIRTTEDSTSDSTASSIAKKVTDHSPDRVNLEYDRDPLHTPTGQMKGDPGSIWAKNKSEGSTSGTIYSGVSKIDSYVPQSGQL